MDALGDLIGLIDDTLALQGRARTFDEQTPLLGAVPELDSLGVVELLAAIEARYGVSLATTDMDASTFATVGSLASFIQQHVGAAMRPAA